jgi:hypothetical protein
MLFAQAAISTLPQLLRVVIQPDRLDTSGSLQMEAPKHQMILCPAV